MTAPATQRRRPTRVVWVGSVPIGGSHPIVIQSMTVADTMDTSAVVAEIRALVAAGCPLVRVTTPHVKAAENLREIRLRLDADGIQVPLIADVHFTPAAALVAAEFAQKVRINPGNYADRKRFQVREYSDPEYRGELERIRDAVVPLIRRCKETGAAMRIGTNHGSLSDRIMNRYGDTPEGMVESALEFVRICEDEGYREIVLSMKSSIPGVMIAAYRLLVRRMDASGMDYPLHLGVTEAGDGLEGRVKSAVGIGALLADGIGDTIRVSLTEDAVHEIPAARVILEARSRYDTPAAAPAIRLRSEAPPWRLGPLEVGGGAPVRVEERVRLDAREAKGEILSLAWEGSWPNREPVEALRARHPGAALFLEAKITGTGDLALLAGILPHVDGASLAFENPADSELVRAAAHRAAQERRALRLRLSEDRTHACLAQCRAEGLANAGVVPALGPGWIEAVRRLDAPVFLEVPFPGPDAAFLAGQALLGGIGVSLCLLPSGGEPWPAGPRAWTEDPVQGAYTILQACRLRMTRAEFIACPSCGRTQFDLQATTARIRALTSHLTGVKIGIMGCIVNGPGEMADADFGYVGSGPGKVDLYVGRERVRQGLHEARAPEELVALIRAHDRWIEPPRPR